jgi:DNA-binding GntR family transcriptional regulator
VVAEIGVVEQLHQAILAGEFAPGQRLVEADLCERFSATRFVVRAALQSMAGIGLVEIRPNRGAIVRKISLAEAVEITEVRRELECLCAARAAERANAADKRALRGLIRDMRAAARDDDWASYSNLNAALHGRIRELSGHQTATDILVHLRAQLVRQQFMLAATVGRYAVSLSQHAAVVDGIIAGNPREAGEAMRLHIDSVIEALQSLSQPHVLT